MKTELAAFARELMALTKESGNTFSPLGMTSPMSSAPSGGTIPKMSTMAKGTQQTDFSVAHKSAPRASQGVAAATSMAPPPPVTA